MPQSNFRAHFFGEENRQLRALLLLTISIAVLIAIADRAPLHMEKHFSSTRMNQEFTSYLDGVITRTMPGPAVYRVLIPYLITAIHTVVPVLAPIDIDFLLKIIILIGCQITFFAYLRIFFSQLSSLAGVLLLDVLIAFSLSALQGPSIIESSNLLDTLAFSGALIAISRSSIGYLCTILFFATLNRETTWLILPIVFLDDYTSSRRFIRSFLAATAVAVPYFGIRTIIHSFTPDWFNFYGLVLNVPFLDMAQTLNVIVANVHVLFLLGPLLILSVFRFKSKPRFLQITFSITPIFILVHYIVGTIIEVRLWMPLFVILIPLALDTIQTIFQSDPSTISPP